MQSCPWCGVPFNGAARFCANCGKERVVEDAAPPAVRSTTTGRRRLFSRRSRVAVGAAAGLVVVTITLVRSQPDSSAPNRPIVASTAAVVPAPSAVAPPSSTRSVIMDSPPPPTWAGRKQTTWAPDGSKTIAFELQATHDVPVWMTRARPILVVRCLYRRTEVFVATGSAAIEPQGDTRTVRVRIDDDPEAVQQWSDSINGQELFAPDGLMLARRLARAREMRFGFTPYNAKPVTAQFHVEGFDQLVGLVAKTCAWRAD